MHALPDDDDSVDEAALYQFFFSDDPDLANVVAKYNGLHDCKCEALCTCDKEKDDD